MLETYLHAQGREWERYAWVKGRVVSWLRSQNWTPSPLPSSIAVIWTIARSPPCASCTAKSPPRSLAANLHDNIKLGPGGIREVEFVTQLFQLVRGGHDRSLRERSTLKTLKQLAQRTLVTSQTADDLRDAYVFLRNLEHRLQYLDDQQTHRLPSSTKTAG